MNPCIHKMANLSLAHFMYFYVVYRAVDLYNYNTLASTVIHYMINIRYVQDFKVMGFTK